MNWKKIISLTLSATLALSLSSTALAAPEGWTPADGARTAEPWYAEAQTYVTEKGYMSTVDGVNFAPEATVTRATVFQTFWNMMGKPEAEKPASFTDIPADAWYAASAAWAEEAGLTTGDAGNYRGERSVTRAELASIFARYARLDGWVADTANSAAASAPDYDKVPAWGAEDAAFCYELGLMTGDQEGRLNPLSTAIRAELATMLMKLDSLVPAYIEENVSFEVEETDGVPTHTVPGTLTTPGLTEGKKLPAVVMLHGTGSARDEAGNGYAMAAPEMAMSNIVTLRIDFMGNGDSEADYSDYCYTSANLDAKAAADYLAGLDYVDADKIAVMGWSQGGTNALLAAAAYPETFQAVITWAGAVTLNESTGLFGDKTFQEAYNTAKKDGSYEMTFDWRDSLQVGERWFKEVDETDVLKQVETLDAPILAINGLADTTVVPENAEQIVAASKNEASRTYLIEDCDHTYNVFSGDFTALYETVYAGIGFLQNTLNGGVSGAVTAVSKYGNVGTDIPTAAFAGAGFEVGDLLTVTVGEQSVDAPYGTGYSNVDTGNVIILADTSNDTVATAINMGNFAGTYGAQVGTEVTYSMKEKAGYLEEYTIRNIDSLRTNDREDYESDEVFANFRPVVMGDIAEGKLYRGSSPVNPELGRNTYVDALVKAAEVKTIIDLADSEEEYAGYEGVAESYAYTTNTVKLDMGVDFAAEDFAGKLKTGLEYMIANEGPYYIHCNEGKDRAGFVTMVLEMLMGGKVDEIVDDYMLSYENYYHVEHDSDRWNRIAQSNVIANLMKLAGVEDEEALAKADLAAAAQTYLTETVGLTAEQVETLKLLLSADLLG